MVTSNFVRLVAGRFGDNFGSDSSDASSSNKALFESSFAFDGEAF